jgi:hypothetical protein
MEQRQLLVVGAGPAGLASALAAVDAGLRPLVVDRADQVGSAWRGRYERLRLNTCRSLSHLPGRRFPRGTPMYPTRNQMIEHVERHAHEDGIELRLGTPVSRIDRDGGGWRLASPRGDLHAAHVVVATGLEREPAIPAWSGRDEFSGRILHSAEYRTATPFRGRRVLVVGPGCSGMEIAHDLATGGAAKVWLSARTPPNILIRGGPGPVPGDMIAVALLHMPVPLADAITRRGQRSDVGDLTPYGLPVPDEGVFARLRRLGVSPSIVDREVIESIKEGRIEIVRAVESLTVTRIELADRTGVEVDDLICATGYATGLEPLVGHLGVLGQRGVPSLQGGRAAAPGLRFVGFVPRPGGIAYMGRQARAAARAIARELRDAPGARADVMGTVG